MDFLEKRLVLIGAGDGGAARVALGAAGFDVLELGFELAAFFFGFLEHRFGVGESALDALFLVVEVRDALGQRCNLLPHLEQQRVLARKLDENRIRAHGSPAVTCFRGFCDMRRGR